MVIKDINDEEPADLISIIIVTYNAGKTLRKCLNSIFNQAYNTIEVLVIDGKSTDDTVKILQENANRIVHWVSEKDSGIYDAMNKGLKYMKGRWVYFLGADDELLSDFSAMANELKDPHGIYYGNVFADGEKRSGELSPYQLAKVGIYHQTMIYPKQVFDRYSFDTKYMISADFAFNIRCYKDKDFHFIYKDYVIALFNHTGISGTKIDEHFARDKPALILKNFGFKIWLRYIFRVLKSKVKGDNNRRV
jgi:hypothetical protein